jgi:flavodoxin
MKTLVIYYSLSGNTKFIAETIAKTTKADLLELKPEEDINPKGFMKFLWGGKLVMSKKEPKLKPFSLDVTKYDLIIIGTPVWAWTFTPALRTFFSQNKLKNKKIALFCCHAGSKGKTFERMQEALGDNEYVGSIDFLEPLKTDRSKRAQEVSEWASKLLS